MERMGLLSEPTAVAWKSNSLPPNRLGHSHATLRRAVLSILLLERITFMKAARNGLRYPGGVRTSTFLLGTLVADRRQTHRNPDQWEFYVVRSGRGGLEEYEAALRDNKIDERVLPNLTQEDLKEISVSIVGHRRRLSDSNQRSCRSQRSKFA